MNEVKCRVEDEASYTPEQKVNVLLVLNNEAVKKKKNNSSDVWNEMANFKSKL